MNRKISLITAPDDLEFDAIRILAVCLSPDQSNTLSDVLKVLEVEKDINLYIYNHADDLYWLVDKAHKADIIFVNGALENQKVAGWLASKRQSCFFDDAPLHKALNNTIVYSKEQIELAIRKAL